MPHCVHVLSASFRIRSPTGVELTDWSNMVCEGAPTSSCSLLPSTGVSRLPCCPQPFLGAGTETQGLAPANCFTVGAIPRPRV